MIMWIETESGGLINLDNVQHIYVDDDLCAIVVDYACNNEQDYIGVYKDAKTAESRFSEFKRYIEKYAEVTLLRVKEAKKVIKVVA